MWETYSDSSEIDSQISGMIVVSESYSRGWNEILAHLLYFIMVPLLRQQAFNKKVDQILQICSCNPSIH